MEKNKETVIYILAIQKLMEEHTSEFLMYQSDYNLDHSNQCIALKLWCLSEGRLSGNFKEAK